MSLRCAIAAVCAAALWTSPVWAQTLTKEEEGRAAVGRCYQICLAGAASGRLFHQASALTGILIGTPVGDDEDPSSFIPVGDDDDPNPFILFDPGTLCEAAIAQVRDMDGCYAGCLDIELAFDVRTSSARNRFLHVFRAERDALRDAGLWTDYRTPPPTGDDFDAACSAYLDSDPEGEAPLLRARKALQPRSQ